ncbi:MAG: hypothetical protein OXE98_06740 [Hyphomicrobiales bacterium]|nr:hypothetical protein [Hyphomicrobiales bacterium]
MKKRKANIPLTVENNLKILGKHINQARLRRKFTMAMVAERADISCPTLCKVEKGESGVAMGAYANVLFCLGLDDNFSLLAGNDPLGRRLQDAELTYTKRRPPKRSK